MIKSYIQLVMRCRRVNSLQRLYVQKFFGYLLSKRLISVVADENSTPSNSSAVLDNDYSLTAAGFGVTDSFPNGHQILMIHPKIRWGRHSASALTTPELQLEEAVTLVKTIPNFTVSNSVIVGTDYNTKKKRIWGRGRLEALVEAKENARATAVMINVDMLSPYQQIELSSVFKAPVFDRYNIVLLIFKLYAKTKEAWLQIELASIPYIRERMKCVEKFHVDPEILHIKFSAESNKFESLRFYEHFIRKKIRQSVAEKQFAVSDSARKKAATTVAVIGYTNAGKSSLIKRLTGKALYVQDRLFATLDASAHFCRLPSGSAIYLVDTIGFISDLPTQLFASFEAALSHVISADLLLLVEDISHPNRLAQREVVLKTLLDLKLGSEKTRNIIFVGNKIDKISVLPDEDLIKFISCSNGSGLLELIALIDSKVMRIRGRIKRLLKLRPGSKALNYLYTGSFLVDEPVVTSDGNHLLCSFIMDEAEFSKFRSLFGVVKPQA